MKSARARGLSAYHATVRFAPLPARSESILQGELQLPISHLCARDLAEGRVSEVLVGIRELRSVERIERFCSKFEGVLFTPRHSKRLHDCEVYKVRSRTDHGVARRVAIAQDAWGEGIRIEPERGALVRDGQSLPGH